MRFELWSSRLLAITCKIPCATTIVALHLLLALVLRDLLARASQDLLLEHGLLEERSIMSLTIVWLFAWKRLFPGFEHVLVLTPGFALALAVRLVDSAMITSNACIL